jgi:hypothetical protein
LAVEIADRQNVAWMERSGIQDAPDFAVLHPGYGYYGY